MLKLNKTVITGSDIRKLKTLEYLKQINLVHSNFEADYLEDLYSFPALEKVYLWNSSNTSDIEIPEPYHSILKKETINWMWNLKKPFEFCNLEKKPSLNVNQ